MESIHFLGRSDLLCAFFYLAGVWFHIGEMHKAAAFAGICATFSKEVGISVFGVYVSSDLILYICTPHDISKPQKFRHVITSSIKNIGVAIALTALHLYLHGQHILYQWSVLENSISLLESRKERFMSYAHVDTVYLWKLFYPWKLSYDWG